MPHPSPFLFPSPFLLPGEPGQFTSIVLEAVSPWADIEGFWNNYNAALATMFESVYDIVADQGDVAQTVVATVSIQLDTTIPLTAIAVQAVSELVIQGTEITLSFAQSSQVFKLAFTAFPGDTTIFVDEATPNYPYPPGTTVQLAFVPGWSRLLDPLECPDQYLPYLGQFNGTEIPPGLDAATARQKILGESAHLRGTTSSITSAIQRNLIGTRSLFVIERVDAIGSANAYWFVVIVRPEEIPNGNAQPIIDAVNMVKPGGVQWTLIQTDGWIISQVEISQATITGLEGSFVTIGGLEQDRPGT